MPRTQISDDGTVRVWRLTDAQGNTIGQSVELYVLPTVDVNANDLRAKAVAALAANGTFLGTVAARRTAIANARTTAQGKASVAVTTVAQAQTEIRALYGMLDQVGAVLTAMNDQAEAAAKQNDAIMRLLVGQLDSVADT